MKYVFYNAILAFGLASSFPSFADDQNHHLNSNGKDKSPLQDGEQEKSLRVKCEHTDDFWCKYLACEGAKMEAKETCNQSQVYLESSRSSQVVRKYQDFFTRVGECTLTYVCSDGPILSELARDLALLGY